jgi:hypothetical protein
MVYRIAVMSDGKWKWSSKVLSSEEEVEAAINKILQHYPEDQVLLCEGSTPVELNTLLRKLNERRAQLEASDAPAFEEPYVFTFPTNQREFIKWLELFIRRREGKLES